MALSSQLHPSTIPLIILIQHLAQLQLQSTAIAQPSPSPPLLDALLHFTLEQLYQSQFPTNFNAWLAQIEALHPKQEAAKVAARVEDTVSLSPRRDGGQLADCNTTHR